MRAIFFTFSLFYGLFRAYFAQKIGRHPTVSADPAIYFTVLTSFFAIIQQRNGSSKHQHELHLRYPRCSSYLP